LARASYEHNRLPPRTVKIRRRAQSTPLFTLF
jgi:hypothetical protein